MFCLRFCLPHAQIVLVPEGRDCEVLCGGMLVFSLLFADDMQLCWQLEKLEGMKRSFTVHKYGVRDGLWRLMHVDKSAVMHKRKSGVDRCSSRFNIGTDGIPVVPTYKYLQWAVWQMSFWIVPV